MCVEYVWRDGGSDLVFMCASRRRLSDYCDGGRVITCSLPTCVDFTSFTIKLCRGEIRSMLPWGSICWSWDGVWQGGVCPLVPQTLWTRVIAEQQGAEALNPNSPGQNTNTSTPWWQSLKAAFWLSLSLPFSLPVFLSLTSFPDLSGELLYVKTDWRLLKVFHRTPIP